MLGSLQEREKMNLKEHSYQIEQFRQLHAYHVVIVMMVTVVSKYFRERQLHL